MRIYNGKNAKEHVQDVQSKLMDCEHCLNQALASVENPQNKDKVQNTLNSVETVKTTIDSYQE